MEKSNHNASNGRGRVHQKKVGKDEELNVIKATYITGKKILVHFSNGRSKMVDFEPIFTKFLKGDFAVFSKPGQFKKFIVDGGNIYWGKNEDVIFPVHTISHSRHSRLMEDEVLYIL